MFKVFIEFIFAKGINKLVAYFLILFLQEHFVKFEMFITVHETKANSPSIASVSFRCNIRQLNGLSFPRLAARSYIQTRQVAFVGMNSFNPHIIFVRFSIL